MKLADIQNKKQPLQAGFINLRWIIIGIVALVIGSYFFNFSVQSAVEDEQTQENFSYIGGHLQNFWDEHLSDPVDYLWNNVFLGLIWGAFTSNMQNLQNGENTVFENSAPGVDLSNIGGIGNLGGIVNNMEEVQGQIQNTAASVVGKPITTGLSGKAKDYVDKMSEKIETQQKQ
jgi:hypothetical protein